MHDWSSTSGREPTWSQRDLPSGVNTRGAASIILEKSGRYTALSGYQSRGYPKVHTTVGSVGKRGPHSSVSGYHVIRCPTSAGPVGFRAGRVDFSAIDGESSLDFFSRILISRTERNSKVRGQWKWEEGYAPVFLPIPTELTPPTRRRVKVIWTDVRC